MNTIEAGVRQPGQRNFMLLCVILGSLLIGLFLLALNLGTLKVPFSTVISIIFGQDVAPMTMGDIHVAPETMRGIILDTRLPLTLTAILAGAALGAAGLCMREFYRTAFLGGRNEIHHCLTGGDFKPDVHHIYFYSCGYFFKRKDYGKQEYCHCRCRDRCLLYDLWIAWFQQALIF